MQLKLFRHRYRQRNRDTRHLYAVYELAYTMADFAAAICFITGSILFFWEDLQVPATSLFVAGSLLFFVKPSIRLAREIHLYRKGHVDRLADRARGD